MAIYTAYIPGIYCLPGGYIVPSTYYHSFLVIFFCRQFVDCYPLRSRICSIWRIDTKLVKKVRNDCCSLTLAMQKRHAGVCFAFASHEHWHVSLSIHIAAEKNEVQLADMSRIQNYILVTLKPKPALLFRPWLRQSSSYLTLSRYQIVVSISIATYLLDRA